MPDDTPNLPALPAVSHFELLQRQARAYATSTLVPEGMRDSPENCMVALMMADEMGESRLAVLQNIYFSHGRPSWYSQFMVSRANQRKKFKGPLRWRTLKFEPPNDIEVQCFADLREGGTDPEVSITIDLKTAIESGWTTFKDSKDHYKEKTHPRWATPRMIEQMLRWRTASWLIRLYDPECMMGLPTREEIDDEPREMIDVTPPPRPQREAVETIEKAAEEDKPEPEPQFWGIDRDGKEVGFVTIGDAAGWLVNEIDNASDDKALDAVRDDNQQLIDKAASRTKGRINQALARRRRELAPANSELPTSADSSTGSAGEDEQETGHSPVSAPPPADTAQDAAEVGRMVGDGVPVPQPSGHRSIPRHPEPSPSGDSKPDRPQAATAGVSPNAKPGGVIKISVPTKSGKADWRTWHLYFNAAMAQCRDRDAMMDLAALHEAEIAGFREAYQTGEHRELFDRLLEEHWKRVTAE